MSRTMLLISLSGPQLQRCFESGYNAYADRIRGDEWLSPPQGAKENGAVERNRTFTGCPTATSTLRVYHFRHDRIFYDRRKYRLQAAALRQGGDAGASVHVANRGWQCKLSSELVGWCA
jgi:hypothetical protein